MILAGIGCGNQKASRLNDQVVWLVSGLSGNMIAGCAALAALGCRDWVELFGGGLNSFDVVLRDSAQLVNADVNNCFPLAVARIGGGYQDVWQVNGVCPEN